PSESQTFSVAASMVAVMPRLPGPTCAAGMAKDRRPAPGASMVLRFSAGAGAATSPVQPAPTRSLAIGSGAPLPRGMIHAQQGGTGAGLQRGQTPRLDRIGHIANRGRGV